MSTLISIDVPNVERPEADVDLAATGLRWRLVPISTPLCTDCHGGGQVCNPLGGSTWCRLCEGSGLLTTEALQVLDDDRKGS